MSGKNAGTNRVTHGSRPQILALAVAAALSVGLGGCNSNTANPSTTSTSTPTTGTASQQFLYAFYAANAGAGPYKVARINLNTLSMETNAETDFSASGGSHKNYYYDGDVWMDSGEQVFGLDPDTLKAVPRAVYPSVQGNRQGNVGSGLVNTKSLSGGVVGTTNPLPKSLQGLSSTEITHDLQLTSITPEQSQSTPFCMLHHAFSANGSSSMLRALSNTATPFYDMGWTPVGIESTPDGKMAMIAVRIGDFILFLDTDPTSPNFGQPVRFVYPNYGIVKDQTNAVVGTFTTPMSGTGAAAGLPTGTLLSTDAGNYRHVRYSSSDPSAGETYIEPCDSTLQLTPSGVAWSWAPDVDADVLTGVNVNQIDGTNPGGAVYNVPVPVVKSAGFSNSAIAAGPWMASLENDQIAFNDPQGNSVSQPLLMSVQYEGENSEGTWNVTDPSHVYEIQRTYKNLANVIDPTDASNPTTGFTPGTTTTDAVADQGYFQNNATYYVKIDYSKSSGVAPQDVAYVYHSLAVDDGTGLSKTSTTTGYLAKANASDPGPQFLLNGLRGRPSSTEANIAEQTGSGSQTVSLSSEIWLNDFVGADGLQIQDLRAGPPFLITQYFNYPTAFYGWMSPSGKYYVQVINGAVRFIDTTTKNIVKTLDLPGPASGNLAFGSYQAPITTSTSTTTGGGSSSSSSSSSGSSGTGALPPPPNPCANP